MRAAVASHRAVRVRAPPADARGPFADRSTRRRRPRSATRSANAMTRATTRVVAMTTARATRARATGPRRDGEARTRDLGAVTAHGARCDGGTSWSVDRARVDRVGAVCRASGGAANASGSFDEGDAGAARRAAAARTRASGSEPETKQAERELNLPLQSAKKRVVGRTRLLRTPMAGGVVSRDTKDSNLPTMATAARNLMELADYGDLSTTMSQMHHRRAGYPFGSTVDFATDATGHPIFCLAPLAIHTRNIQADGRCSLTVKMSGWGGLANARVTIFGDVERLPGGEYQTAANEIFKAKYHGRKEAIDMEDRWGDYTYYRMNRIVDVYFVGGFGTLNWIKLDEYMGTSPDTIVTSESGQSVIETLSELNARFASRLAILLGETLEVDVDDIWIISIDRRGMDIRVRYDGSSLIRRISFEFDVECFADAARAVECALAGDGICAQEF